MSVYSEESYELKYGAGLNIYDPAVLLADGESPYLTNVICYGDRIETRLGFKRISDADLGGDVIDEFAGYRGQFDSNYFRIPTVSEDSFPVALFNVNGSTYGIRQFVDDLTGVAGDSRSAFASIANLTGATLYLDRLFLNCNAGLGYTTAAAIDWFAHTMTFTAAGGTPPSNTRGLFTFKDRLWCWDDNKIWYTDAPSSPGDYPNTWAATNFLVVNAGTGMGKIFSVIPAGTKLYVFTATGLYNVSVLGSPENWVVRLQDGKVQVNTNSCAIEYQGYIYFVDSNGVFVTDGASTKCISKPIQPIFDQNAGTNHIFLFKIFPFETGFIILRMDVRKISSGNNTVDANGRMFYTEFEDVAWSEWTISSQYATVTDIHAAFPRMETYDRWHPQSYLVMSHSTGSGNEMAAQLYVYEGWEDYAENVDASYDTQQGVECYISSKVERGQRNVMKRGKEAYINMLLSFATGQLPDINYYWYTDDPDNAPSGTIATALQLETRDVAYSIPGPEYFKNIQLDLEVTLTTGVRSITFFGASILVHTGRNDPRREGK
jgi:hypothetical protein